MTFRRKSVVLLAVAVTVFVAAAYTAWWYFSTDAYKAHRLVDELRRSFEGPGVVQRWLSKLELREDSPPRCQGDIASDLASLGKAAVPALISGLEDENPNIRGLCAVALGKMGPEAKDAVPSLVRALGDTGEVSYVAARGPESEATDGGNVTTLVVDALVQIGEPSVAPLIVALKDEQPYVRAAACVALGRIGPSAGPAVPHLLNALKDPTKMVRMMAGPALVRLGRAEAGLPIITSDLKDPRAQVRRDAAWTLGDIGPAAAGGVPALCDALKDRSSSVRQAAAEALGKIGPGAKEAVPVLEEALADDDEYVREAAAAALAKMGPAAETCIPALLRSLKDVCWVVRMRAAAALVKLGREKEGFSALAEGLRHEHAYVRAAAAERLGELGGQAEEAIPGLRKALKDEDGMVRWAARDALKKIQQENE